MKLNRLSINHWLILKYVIWGLLNLFFIYKNYSLTDVYIINAFILIIHAITKVSSVAMGMTVFLKQEQDMIKDEQLKENLKALRNMSMMSINDVDDIN
jgi:D-alanyl-lipoteichoic acid acyltransferase DltB (MBOAT superfamily)